MGLQLITAPAIEPVDLGQAKLHLRVVTDDQDQLITSHIKAAREAVESFTHRALITQTWELTWDRFPTLFGSTILLDKGKLQQVDSLTYIDADGATQTLHDAIVSPAITGSIQEDRNNDEGGRVTPAFGESWPGTRDVLNAVTLQFQAGYGNDQEDIPEPIRMAMMLAISDLHEHREETVIGATTKERKAFDALLMPYRVDRWLG